MLPLLGACFPPGFFFDFFFDFFIFCGCHPPTIFLFLPQSFLKVSILISIIRPFMRADVFHPHKRASRISAMCFHRVVSRIQMERYFAFILCYNTSFRIQSPCKLFAKIFHFSVESLLVFNSKLLVRLLLLRCELLPHGTEHSSEISQ